MYRILFRGPNLSIDTLSYFFVTNSMTQKIRAYTVTSCIRSDKIFTAKKIYFFLKTLWSQESKYACLRRFQKYKYHLFSVNILSERIQEVTVPKLRLVCLLIFFWSIWPLDESSGTKPKAFFCTKRIWWVEKRRIILVQIINELRRIEWPKWAYVG